MRIRNLPFLPHTIGQAAMLIMVGLTLIVLILLAINQHVVQPAFQELERKQALEDNARVQADIEHEIASLVNLANDWAHWDDAYAFAQNRDQGFIETHCADPAIVCAKSGIDLLAFYDRDGHNLFQDVFHPSAGHVIHLKLLTEKTSSIQALLAPIPDHETPMEGLVATEHGLLLLVARPILTTSGNGPSRGVILVGRFFTDEKVQALAERTKVAINILPRHDKALAPFEQRLFDHLAAQSIPARPILEGGFVYRMLTDIEMKPLMLLRTPERSEITALGKHTGRMLSALLGAIAFCLLCCLVMCRYRREPSQLALETSEARYRQLFECEADAIFLIDNQSGRIIEANQAAVNLYGFDHEELLTQKISDLSAEPLETQRISNIPFTNDGQVVTIPLRYHLKKDGTVFPVEITGRFFTYQGRPVHISAIRDITERRRAEAALRFTQFVIDHSADSIFWVTNEGRFSYVNQEACRSLGYTEEEFHTMTIADIDPDFPFETWPEFFQELKTQKYIRLESRHITKDGKTFPVEIKTNFFEFDGREGSCAIVRDISERQQMERKRMKLKALNSQLHKEKSLGRMAGAIAHHFNNQLMAVMGFIGLAMHKQAVKGESCSQELTNALAAANKGAELSSLMLTYLGQTASVQRPMDLAEVCRQHLPLLQAILPAEVVLETDFPAPGSVVAISPEQLQQILTNLTTNSIEAIGETSGCIELSINTLLSDDIPAVHRFPVGWRLQNRTYACLTVADNGCGIAPGNIKDIFDPFFSTKFTGRGLGLAVVLGLVKAHGGGVTVESEPGKGTVFRVFLPLLEERQVE